MQVVLELVLASILSEYLILILLTDLRDTWRSFWLKKAYIAFHHCGLSSGVFT